MLRVSSCVPTVPPSLILSSVPPAASYLLGSTLAKHACESEFSRAASGPNDSHTSKKQTGTAILHISTGRTRTGGETPRVTAAQRWTIKPQRTVITTAQCHGISHPKAINEEEEEDTWVKNKLEGARARTHRFHPRTTNETEKENDGKS
ncbi:hypothetical protein Q5P01_017420 [Channa striata]|uniref:Uncharacterized protein n=1 Tax=Channa striata TaxID=64152 RepID=A0AA88MD92_CHASR|nr:hypothetical protein Q5P01_017420 [Channa striata]